MKKISRYVTVCILFWVMVLIGGAECNSIALTIGTKLFALVCGFVMVGLMLKWKMIEEEK